MLMKSKTASFALQLFACALLALDVALHCRDGVGFLEQLADKHMLPDLLHGEERKVWGDGGYQGQGEAIRQAAPRAQDMTSRRVQFKNFVDELQKAKNRVKARVRAKVEHPFRILKRIFGFEKVRYRGIKKNHHRLCASFALVNLYLHRRRLAVARAWA
jgi:transposase, IS5 family